MPTTLVSAPDLRTPKILRDEWPFGRLFEGFREILEVRVPMPPAKAAATKVPVKRA